MRSLSPNTRFKYTPTVLDEGVERFDGWEPPVLTVSGERLHVVTESDQMRPDLIAWKYYSDPALWWVIMHHNGVIDPYSLKPGDKLRVPFYNAGAPPSSETFPEAPEFVLAEDRRIPPYQAPATAADVPLSEPTIYNFGFPIPPCLVGPVWWEIQVGFDGSFENLLISSISNIEPDRWYFFDALDGEGKHKPYPTSGVDGELYRGQTVYFQFRDADGMVSGQEYYVRFRPYVRQNGVIVKLAWASSPPIIPIS